MKFLDKWFNRNKEMEDQLARMEARLIDLKHDFEKLDGNQLDNTIGQQLRFSAAMRTIEDMKVNNDRLIRENSELKEDLIRVRERLAIVESIQESVLPSKKGGRL